MGEDGDSGQPKTGRFFENRIEKTFNPSVEETEVAQAEQPDTQANPNGFFEKRMKNLPEKQVPISAPEVLKPNSNLLDRPYQQPSVKLQSGSEQLYDAVQTASRDKSGRSD